VTIDPERTQKHSDDSIQCGHCDGDKVGEYYDMTQLTVVGVVEVVDDRPVVKADDGEHGEVEQRPDVQRETGRRGHRTGTGADHGTGHGLTGDGAGQCRAVDRRPGRYVRHAECASGLDVDERDDGTTGG